MEGYEDDDDTHFCIKCHLTMHGLETYVRHRQSGCRPPDDKNENVHVSPATPTTVSYPEILNADAFFSSLELQSSAKSNPRRATGLLESDRQYKKNSKRKKANGKSPQVLTEDSKEKIHGMLPGVGDLDDPTEHLCIPSLVGFPDIVTSSKAVSAVDQTKIRSIRHASMSIEGGAFPIKHEPENSLEGLIAADSKQADRKRPEEAQRADHQSHQHQMHHHQSHRAQHQQQQHQQHQNWLDDTMLADLVENNENKELARYEFEYQQDDDSVDDMLDEELAEDESYSESDEAEDRERPPRGHTGGKWKPGLDDLPQDMSQLHEDEPEVDEDHQEHPPPSYTGGKWTSTETSQKMEEYESKDTVTGQPPPGHTRGKWVPGARADIDSGYWCNPCGRKLASRLVYNRHLLSDLHARRSIQEIDGALRLPRDAMDVHAARRTSTRRRAALAARVKPEPEEGEAKKSSRRREKEVLSCEMCHARVRKPQMGKHLLSHYHCRVAGINPRSPRARRFLLENMANVVHQCPFQCASCRFYCNTEETFLLHWRSPLHAETLKWVGGSYKCSSCDYWCADNETMEAHLVSGSHRDVVSMMNGSVPVVIVRHRAIQCSDCDRHFRYNLQLRQHAKESGHKGGHTASDEYQWRITCSHCPQVVRSLVSLQRHQLARHVNKEPPKNELAVSTQPTPYFCSFCSMNFVTAQEAILHRRTSAHKEMVKSRRYQRAEETDASSLSPSTDRTCPHCDCKQSTLVEHKEHLLRNHPDLCHRCPQCGMIFALSQDVTRHTREKNCRKDNNILVDGSKSTLDSIVEQQDDQQLQEQDEQHQQRWRCDSCRFSTDSEAELIFHEALHAGSIERLDAAEASEHANKDTHASSLSRYRCPVCEKIFSKVTLRNHIRSHTGERPFPCAKCYATFSRRSDLNAHRRNCCVLTEAPTLIPSSTTTTTTTLKERQEGTHHPTHRRRGFVCSECNDAFYTKHALRQHMLRHAGKKYKCGLPGCPTVLRTASELKSHRMLVHETSPSDRRYPCDNCSYAAKTKTQLRRHQNRHEDTTNTEKLGRHTCPFSGCNFRTKLGSHLRRHVRLHTGTKPYRCRHCSYACNNVENLRKHVLSTTLHPGKTIYECDFCETKADSDTFRTNFTKELRAHLYDNHSDEFPTPEHARNYVLNIFERDDRIETLMDKPI